MSYVVLARKWRPLSFEHLIGQEHVRVTLANSIALGRVAHAFLFTGVRGVGKTTSARILAKALNCETGPTATPCLKCPACIEIGEGRDMDVMEIDGATYTGIDRIRELQESLPYRPARDRFKVYIVDEVHMLSNHAWNAFLKTLEEPPPHVKFIFATTEVQKVPITILSRCQRYDFKLIGANAVQSRLRYVIDQEGIQAEDEALSILAREAAGSMRDAMSLLDQVIAWAGPGEGGKLTSEGVARVLGVASRAALHDLAAAIALGDAATALKHTHQLADQGYDIVHVARDLLGYLRDLVVTRVSPEERSLVDVPDGELGQMKELSGKSTVDDLVRIHQGLSKSFDDIARSIAPRASFEMCLVRLASRPPLLPMDELVKRLGELEHKLSGGPSRGGGGASGGAPAGGQGGGAPPRGASRMAEAAGSPSDKAFQEFSPPARFAANPPTSATPAPNQWGPPPNLPESTLRGRTENVEAATSGTQSWNPPAMPSARPPPPPMQVSDEERASLGVFAQVVEQVRASNGRVASLFERAHLIHASRDKIEVGFEKGGFELDQANNPAAKALVESAAHRALDASPEILFQEIAPGGPRLTLSRYLSEARQKKRNELEDSVRNHPLVAAAIRELGAEIRDVRLPDDIEVELVPSILH